MRTIIITVTLLLPAAAAIAETPIVSSDQAVERVLELTGLAKDLDLKGARTAEVMAYKDSTIPFIPDVDSRRAWKVTIEDVPLIWDKDSVFERAEAYVDSSSGELLRITFRPHRETNLVREPTSDEATLQLATNREKFHGFPSEVPQTTLMAAMKISTFFSLHSDEIIVWYVDYSWTNERKETRVPVPAWVIYLRGTLPDSNRDWVPLHMRNHRRYVVNAMDGTSMHWWGCNFPYPWLEEED